MLLRFDPFREIDRVFEQNWGQGRASAIPMDAVRRGDRFVVSFDLPGVDPASIDLTVEQNVLTVTAERRWQPVEGEEIVASERRQGVFSRRVLLGNALDTERIEAAYDNGVLSLTIPVAEKAKTRKIAIETATPELLTSAN